MNYRLKNRIWGTMIGCLLLLLLISCGEKGGGENPTNVNKIATAVVGISGYTFNISSPDSNVNKVKLYIPPGALSRDVDITISTTTSCDLSEFGLANDNCFVLEPSNITFSVPVEFTVPYDDVYTHDDLIFMYYNEVNFAWEKIAINTIDSNSRTVTAKLSHFSKYGIFSNQLKDNCFDSYLYKNTISNGITAKINLKYNLDQINLKLTENRRTALDELRSGLLYGNHSPYFVYKVDLNKKNNFLDLSFSEISSVYFYVFPVQYLGNAYKFAYIDKFGDSVIGDKYVTSDNADQYYKLNDYNIDFKCGELPCIPEDNSTYFTNISLVLVDGRECADSLIAGYYCNSSTEGSAISQKFVQEPSTMISTPLPELVPATSYTYSISGKVTYGGSGLMGVIVSTNGGAATTDSSGNYTISGLASGAYIVMASKPGYTMSAAQVVTINNANITDTNFTATSISSATFSISGRVTLYGSGLPNFQVLVEGKNKFAMTNSSGNYTISGLANGTYRVFTYSTQPVQEIIINNADVFDVNFTVTPVSSTYSVSGQVTLNGAGLSGVTVNTTGGSATTNSNGNYTISGLANGAYTVTASKAGYTISAAQTVTINNANVSGTNFTATAVSSPFSISGQVTLNGVGLSGVTVNTTDGSATTNSNGNYTISGLANGAYTVTASKTGYTMSAAQAVTINNANVSGTNFTATAVSSTYSISGQVTLNGAGLSGVAVSTTGGSATTNSNGNYTISGLANGNYTVTASKTGYTMSVAQAVTINNANSTGKNFTATEILNLTGTYTFKLVYTSVSGSCLNDAVGGGLTGYLQVSQSGNSISIGPYTGTINGNIISASTDYTIFSGIISADGKTINGTGIFDTVDCKEAWTETYTR
jgi:hypothetical protein